MRHNESVLTGAGTVDPPLPPPLPSSNSILVELKVYAADSMCALQESLGGNAKTSLVIAVANAEDHLDESLQSLQFGSRAMRILTRAVVNERMDIKVENKSHAIRCQRRSP